MSIPEQLERLAFQYREIEDCMIHFQREAKKAEDEGWVGTAHNFNASAFKYECQLMDLQKKLKKIGIE